MYTLLLNSRERPSDSTSSTSFVATFSTLLPNIQSVQLQFASLPITNYNISSNNNIVTFNENSTTKTATLTQGCYSAIALATELTSKLTTASGGYNTFTVTYDSTSMHFVVSAGNDFSLTCSATKFPYRELGFTLADIDSTTSIESIQAVSLEQPTCYVISIEEFDHLLYKLDGTRINGTFTVPISNSSRELQVYEPEHCIVDLDLPVSIKQLTIELRDTNGIPLNLQGSDWSFQLLLRTDVNKHC